MNFRIIVLLILFLMLVSAILIYREYHKSLTPARSPKFIAATFLFLTFIIFNVIQWEGFIFDISLLDQEMRFFIASFISLELFLSKGDCKYLPAAFILTFTIFNVIENI